MDITMGEPLHSAWMSLVQEQINYRTGTNLVNRKGLTGCSWNLQHNNNHLIKMKSESEIQIFGIKMMMKSDLDFFPKIPLCLKKYTYIFILLPTKILPFKK